MTHSRSALADIGVIMKVWDTIQSGSRWSDRRATESGGHAETCYSVAEGRTEIRPTLRIVQGAHRGGKAGESHAGLRVECGNGASEGWARH